jgi:hypothetical protein
MHVKYNENLELPSNGTPKNSLLIPLAIKSPIYFSSDIDAATAYDLFQPVKVIMLENH